MYLRHHTCLFMFVLPLDLLVIWVCGVRSVCPFGMYDGLRLLSSFSYDQYALVHISFGAWCQFRSSQQRVPKLLVSPTAAPHRPRSSAGTVAAMGGRKARSKAIKGSNARKSSNSRKSSASKKTRSRGSQRPEHMLNQLLQIKTHQSERDVIKFLAALGDAAAKVLVKHEHVSFGGVSIKLENIANGARRAGHSCVAGYERSVLKPLVLARASKVLLRKLMAAELVELKSV